MEPLQFKEIRELLNSCRLTTIEDIPAATEKGSWELYRGRYKAHVVEVPFEVLYFFSDATKESVKRAAKLAFKPKATFVVYAPSAKVLPSMKAEFPAALGFWTTTEYLESFMASELKSYRAALERLRPSNYVDPVVEPPAGVDRRFPNPLELFLTDPETSREQEGGGSVAVVLAEAGHGKTYMCEWLVSKLASRSAGVLPIFVNSHQWQQLRPEELSSLGTTILSSFRALGAPMPWVEGQEELFLRVALKAGLFRVVFDGFDEYILRTPGGISAGDTLAALASLAADTGTRLIVTSRTSFWQAELPTLSSATAAPDVPPNVFVYHLKPFGTDLAKSYFRLRFPNDSKMVDAADATFRELARDDATFAGRGFVLLLVADLIASGESLPSAGEREKPMIRLIRAHCDREIRRQQLPLTSDQQIEALRHFVFETIQGEEPNNDLLKYSIQLAAKELREDDVDGAIQKMAPHALIVREAGRWRIRQPQVLVALLAMHLIELSSADSMGRLLTTFSNRRLDPGIESDLAAMLTSLIIWRKPELEGQENGRKLIGAFFRASSGSVEALRHQVLRRLSTLIALRVVDGASQSTHRERAKLLASLFPGSSYVGAVFFGGIARFDWSGFTFKDCVFDNVRWSNCTFDGETVFHGCHLLGGSAQYCKDFAESQWVSCFVDDAGRQFRDSESVRAGRKAYTEDLLKHDIASLLDKFLGRGGVGFRTVEAGDLLKGKLSASSHAATIVEVVRRELLDEHHISGGNKTGLHVRDEVKEEMRALFANNVWTGKLSEALAELKRRLNVR